MAAHDDDVEAWSRIGKAIARERGSMSQTVLAGQLRLSRQATISEWENGKGRPSLGQLAQIEKALRLPRGHFLRIGGFVDESSERTTVEAIRGAAELEPGDRDLLLAAYDSFRRRAGRVRR